MRDLDFGEKKSSGMKDGFLPQLVEKILVDLEFVKLVVEVVVSIVKCVCLGQSKDCEDYKTVMKFYNEVMPWFSILDANAYEKLHRLLGTYLGKCTLFLVGEMTYFDEEIVCSFCVMSMKEYLKPSMRDQIYKFSHRICSTLFLHQEVRSPFINRILKIILDFLANLCKEDHNWGIDFVDLVSYCAKKCRTTSTNFYSAVEGHLNTSNDGFQTMEPLGMILWFYVTGSTFTDSFLKSIIDDATSFGSLKDDPVASSSLSDGARLSNLAHLLGALRNFFNLGRKKNCLLCGVEYKDLDSLSSSESDSFSGTSLACTRKDGKVSVQSYLNALKFLCQPLAEIINLEKKQIVSENGVASISSFLFTVQEAFDLLLDIFLFTHSPSPEREENDFDDNQIILSVAVAAFILSIRARRKFKKSVHLLKHIITSKWIKSQGLKYIFASLYNLGVHFYRNKQLKEASKSLQLSSRASWTVAVNLCQMYKNKSNGLTGDLSEDMLTDFVTEACARTSFLLDVVYQCVFLLAVDDKRGRCKIEKIIINGLENWSVTENLLRRLPGPMPLVKQWVKVQCQLIKNLDVNAKASTLYHLLSSSEKFSMRAIGKILYQELCAYEEMNSKYPEFCPRQQLEIVDILLNMCSTQDSYIERSNLLLRKALALRASGFENLKHCIQCLTDVISIIIGEKCRGGISSSHQLAVAHCLRALCMQEVEPNSKQGLQDIKAATTIWLSILVSDGANEISDRGLILLYNIIDLLAIKGSLESHSDLYKLLFRIFERKTMPLENFLPILWASGRLTHALCVSPVYEELLQNLSRNYGEDLNSSSFWMHCLKGSSSYVDLFQQKFSYLFASIPCSSHNHEILFQSDITVDNVKQAARELISSDSVTSYSIFSAGCLYYDLCEKLIASGRLFEALYYAKESHQLRTKLFQEYFKYSVERLTEKHIEVSEPTQKNTCVRNLQVNKLVVCKLWYTSINSSEEEVCYLSPWKVLQCYLESTLQVGIINEIIGNAGEAETFLSWGKDISIQQGLSIFIVAFSSVLGKLYRKKRSWNLSEKELQSAKQMLGSVGSDFSCIKCRLVLEATVDLQLADLSQNCIVNSARDFSMERLTHAESLYKSSLDKLNFSEWKSSVSVPEEVEDGIKTDFGLSNTRQLEIADMDSIKTGANTKVKVRKNRQTKSSARTIKDQPIGAENNTRVTRSKYRSSQNQTIDNSEEVTHDLFKHPNGNGACDLPDVNGKKKSLSEKRSSLLDSGCVKSFCSQMKCLFCRAVEVKKSESLMKFINMKWDLVRRQLFIRVLSGRGKCLDVCGKIHEAREIILQGISVLVSHIPLSQSYSPVSNTLLLDLVGKEFFGDAFAVEHAILLYDLSWFSLKSYHSSDNRTVCCDLSHVQLQKVVSWLMLAFVLSREVPELFQKVSRLLACILIVYSSSEQFSLPSDCKELSEAHWAAYFHQASLGTHLAYQYFSSITQKCKAEHLLDDQMTCSRSKGAETCTVPRVAPKSLQDLEHSVAEFFSSLPCTTVICISVIGDPYATLLQELLIYPSGFYAWMLLSRLNFKNQPIVMLLPVGAISEDDDALKPFSEEFLECKDLDKHWHCPWGFTVIDELAPAYKHILEENYRSSSIFPVEDTKENRSLWWTRRKKLDIQLGKLLRKLEDLWLGPLRHVLLGDLLNCKDLDVVQKKLMRNLKSKCKVDLNESVLRIILGGGRHVLDGEAYISDLLFLKNGFYIGKELYSNEETCQKLSKEFGGQKMSNLAIQLIHDAVNELEEDSVDREPVILVLDFDVQMFPWENLPILRDQEVYRMPSVGSICLTLDRSCNHQEQVGRISAAFPSIDPSDAFYLLNPSGDLSSTQIEFENWFRDQNFEGKAGCAPTSKELAVALKNHDLFLYFGHGSGAQYISQQEIQKLENCAATLLMGCSSGALSLNGSYIPQGTPLSYLLAGSPTIIANLWDVTDKDIDRFGKAMLDAWLKERSGAATDCIQCNLLAEEFQAMNLKEPKITKKRGQKKKEPEICDDVLKNGCYHRPKIGSFMSQAREACTLPFLIGASPVCYGVPTGIRRKKDL